MPNQTFYQERRTCLTCLILWFLAGSGIWLKLILSDVEALSLTHELLYEREYLATYHWNVARGLNITSDLSECEFKKKPKKSGRLLDMDIHFAENSGEGSQELSEMDPDPMFSSPPPSSPPSHFFASPPPPFKESDFECAFGARVLVNATLDEIEQPIGPLYFVLYGSHDFVDWKQVSVVDVKTSRFIVDTKHKKKHRSLDQVEGLDGDDVEFEDVDDDERDSAVAAKEEAEAELELAATAESGWPPPPPLYPQQVIPAKYISTVHAHACIDQPDFIYLMGCVKEGFKRGKLESRVTPPFDDCVALAGICGATCGSGVLEPSYNDPSKVRVPPAAAAAAGRCRPSHADLSSALLCTPLHSSALLCTPLHSSALLCTPLLTVLET
jgi:hypothetical protein